MEDNTLVVDGERIQREPHPALPPVPGSDQGKPTSCPVCGGLIYPGEEFCYPCAADQLSSPAERAQQGGRDVQADLLRELHHQRIRRQARRQLDAEERPPAELPEVLSLRERLERPRPPVTYRVEGWQPTGARVMLAAQFKAGKTTLTGNLVRSLVDADLFLERFTVAPVDGTVAVVDFEMSPAQLDTWLADQKIRSDDRVVMLPLRGNAAAFDILDQESRARWVALLRRHGVSYLVLDCLRPVLDSLGLDEHREAGRFLVAFDALLSEAGISEAAVVHHMGHAAERSRGDSRIRDWPDVEWRLVRQDDDPASPRYLSAYGRDVDQAEAELRYDPISRHLTLVGGSRRDAGARAALVEVLNLLTEQPGMSANAVELALTEDTEHGQKAVRAAIKIGLKEKIISREKAVGRRGYALFRAITHTHSVTESVSPSESVQRMAGSPRESVSPSIGTDYGLSPDRSESPSADDPTYLSGFEPKCWLCRKRQLRTETERTTGTCAACQPTPTA